MRSTVVGGVTCVESARVCSINRWVKGVNVARIFPVLDVALAGVILLVAVDGRTFSRWCGIGACGACGVGSGD